MGLRGPLSRSAIAAPPPPSPPLPPPEWLPARVRAVWDEIEPSLRLAGRLRPEHTDCLAQYCASVAELRALTVAIATEGLTTDNGSIAQVAKHAARLRGVLILQGRSLGLDPTSAAKLDAAPTPESAETDPIESFVRKRDDIAARRAGG